MLSGIRPPEANGGHVLSRVLSHAAEMPAEAAKWILEVSLSPEERERINDLATRNQDGLLTPSELEELEEYVQLDDLIGILQSKARETLAE